MPRPRTCSSRPTSRPSPTSRSPRAGRAGCSAWLTRLVIHEAVARARRRGRFVQIDEEGDEMDTSATLRGASPSPEEQAFTGELRSLIEGAIEALPDAYRAVFMLRA